MSRTLMLLFVLCTGQLPINFVFGALRKNPLTKSVTIAVDTRSPTQRGKKPDLAIKMRRPTTDAVRSAEMLSHGQDRLRAHRRHHRIKQPYQRVKMACAETSTDTLVNWLGPAFNARYMSIDIPPRELFSVSATLGESPATHNRRRKQAAQPKASVSPGVHGDFRVDGNFSRILKFRSTWQLTRKSDEIERVRIKRAHRSRKRPVSNRKRPVRAQWECAQKVVWRDLGEDYFPRYLRSVVCTQRACWFGAFECRPRAFTVKVLRRDSDECLPVYDGSTTRRTAASTGKQRQEAIPIRYEQAWVFEELAVSFCCDCAARGSTDNLRLMLRGYAGVD